MKRLGLVLLMAVAGCSTVGRGGVVAEPQVCAQTTVPIYFEESQAGLTGPARELLGTTAESLRGCNIERVRVIGLASATGSASANLTLSEQRAVTVAAALEDAGWPTPAFELEAVGDAGAASGGVADPVRRRVELIVEASPR